MATALSAKALSNLVCESSVRSSESVLAQELDRNLNDLFNGVLARNQPSEKTDESSKKKSGKLAIFLSELGAFLGVDKILGGQQIGASRGSSRLIKWGINNFL